MMEPMEVEDYWPRVTIKYSGPFTSPEMITIQGRTKNALLIKTYQSDVRANFAVTVNFLEPRIVSRYEWVMRDYERCDKICHGYQTRKPACISTENFKRVDETYCNRHLKPSR